MNLNFHHRHYSKCTKCHKIHADNQPGTNNGFLDTLSNEDHMKKDIDAQTEENNETEWDDTSHRYQSTDANRNSVCHMPRNAAITSPLEKLNQLQKERASSDNYYSKEIQKIIGKYFMATSDANKNYRTNNSEHDRYNKTAENEELEQCGMITTIIRLDCGCVQKTRKPIYTPSIADAHGTHYYHCTDGEIDGDADTTMSTSPLSSPTRFQVKPTLFERPPRRSRAEITNETTMQHTIPNSNSTSLRHSTLKSTNSKSLRDSCHRKRTS